MKLSKLNSFIIQAEKIITQISLFCIVILIFISSVFRYMGMPLVWAIDISQLLFAWITFLGADLAFRSNNHIGVDYFIQRFLSQENRKKVYLLQYSLIILFLLVICIYGINLTLGNTERLFNTIQLSYAYATVSAPIGAVLMIRTAVGKIIEIIKGKADFIEQETTEKIQLQG